MRKLSCNCIKRNQGWSVAIISGRVLDQPHQMPFFPRNSNPSAPAQKGNLPFYSARSARKKLHHFPFKLSHLSPAILQCRAFEIGNSASVTIDTYTAGAWKGAGQDMVFDLFVLNSVRVCPQQDEICLYKYTKPDCNANLLYFNCQ